MTDIGWAYAKAAAEWNATTRDQQQHILSRLPDFPFAYREDADAIANAAVSLEEEADDPPPAGQGAPARGGGAPRARARAVGGRGSHADRPALPPAGRQGARMKTCLQNQRITPRLIPTSPTVVRDVARMTRSDWALVAALGVGGAGFLAAAFWLAGGL